MLRLGVIIDTFPVHGEEKRSRGSSSPIESTRISIVVVWALFITGTALILQEGRLAIITGTVTIVAAALFLFTALAFSFAVLHTMKHRTTKMTEAADMAELEAALIRVSRTTGISPHDLLARQQKRRQGMAGSLAESGIEK
ncbi:MAG: hypothetical protein CW742_13355 [Methanoregula sp.]|nr:MAG: hypothetical protein CW742_13355 [Methanoregula sp.]